MVVWKRKYSAEKEEEEEVEEVGEVEERKRSRMPGVVSAK